MTESAHEIAGLLASGPLPGLLLTLAAYELGLWAKQHLRSHPLADPVLVATASILAVLALTNLPWEAYMRGAGLLEVFLGPATVALAVPLHANLRHLKGAAPAILTSVCAGAATAAASAVALAWALGAPEVVLRSIAPKSTTMPIALGIAGEIGGEASLTAGLVFVTGLVGSLLSGPVLNLLGVTDWRARGLATGTATHGIGTARILGESTLGGAFSALALALSGWATAVALPLVARLL